MHLDGIRLFILSVKHRNITQAARELRISQSAASRQIKQLESQLGTQLFAKSGRGRELTRCGQSFFNDVLPIWSRFDEVKKKYAPCPASVTIAATHQPSKYLLPALMSEFSRKHSSAKLTLHTRNSVEIEKLLLESIVDLAVTTNPIGSMSSFVSEPYCREPLTAFVAASHPAARMKSLRTSEMGTIPLIVKFRRDGQSRVEAQLSKYEEEGIKFTTVLRCESPEVVKEFVRQGVGIGFLYFDAIKRGVECGEFKTLQIPGFDVAGQNYIVYPKDRPLSALAREFLSLVRASMANAERFKPVARQILNRGRNGQLHSHEFPTKLLFAIISFTGLDGVSWVLSQFS